MQPLQICIGPTIRIGRESWCLPYAGFFRSISALLLFSYTHVNQNLTTFTHLTHFFQINSNITHRVTQKMAQNCNSQHTYDKQKYVQR